MTLSALHVQSKECTSCKEVLPSSAFYKNPKRSTGLHNECKPCQNARRRSNKRVTAYGVTPVQFNKMLEQQGGACAICGTSIDQKAHVDHCHTSGKVRGLLCNNCNTAIGKLKDNPEIIQSALDYVKVHTDSVP
ncbi:MAG: hypothetical protein CMJ25_11365 [Phycisphaerae bacterium]|nr:hypothetical protein [Phycisphaerae bacterium]